MSIPGHGFDYQDMEDDHEPGHEVEPDTYYFSGFLLFVLLGVLWGCYAGIGYLHQ